MGQPLSSHFPELTSKTKLFRKIIKFVWWTRRLLFQQLAEKVFPCSNVLLSERLKEMRKLKVFKEMYSQPQSDSPDMQNAVLATLQGNFGKKQKLFCRMSGKVRKINNSNMVLFHENDPLEMWKTVLTTRLKSFPESPTSLFVVRNCLKKTWEKTYFLRR